MVHGTIPRPLLVVAHYDAPLTSAQAAADNGTGAAVLLELARVLPSPKPARSLILLASDAGVWGSIGADVFARDAAWTSLPGGESAAPYAAISLDHLSPGGGIGIETRGGGQFRGFAPLWLRTKVAVGMRAMGVRVFPEGPVRQLTARAFPFPRTAQGVLLKRGIAAINLAVRPADEAEARRTVFTEADVLANIRPGALRLFGTAAEFAISAVLGAGITDSPDVVTISAEKTLPRSSIRIMAGLLFLPLGTIAITAALRRRLGALSLLRAAAWALPVALAALAMRLAVARHLLPRFSLYPGTLRDPFLTAWQPLPMLAVLVAAVLGALLARKAARGGCREAGLVLLLLAGLWAWTRNDLAAAMLLAPAAWAWPWLGASTSGRGRALDALLFLLGAAPIFVLLVVAGERLFLGPWILWYGALMTGYGVVSLHAVLAGALALAAARALHRRPAPRPAADA